jgi:hypothetical protein
MPDLRCKATHEISRQRIRRLSGFDATSLSSRSSSTLSGQTSPSKQLSSLKLAEEGGIESRTFHIDDYRLPDLLAALLVDIVDAVEGQ